MKTDALTAIHPELPSNIELLKGVHACIELARKELRFGNDLSDMEFMQAIRLAYPPHDFAAACESMTARIEADVLALKYAVIGGSFELVQRLHRTMANR